MNNPYKIHIDPGERTCAITFFFDDGEPVTLPTRYYDGIEEDVRRNFYAWRAHAFAYSRERAKVDQALDALLAVPIERR
ncbi:MAG: hypothetical protein IJ662_04355 [Clostridia bacterium]|nr:hypothetical protein [Clostridia bacterium]